MRNSIRLSFLSLIGMLLPVIASAEEHAAAAATGSSSGGLIALAAGLGIALAVIAAATAQGRIAASYMEGASRNPGAEKVMKTQLILSLVFVETLVIFTLLIAIMLLGKI